MVREEQRAVREYQGSGGATGGQGGVTGACGGTGGYRGGTADGRSGTAERAGQTDSGRGRQTSCGTAGLAIGAATRCGFVLSGWCNRVGALDTDMFAGLEWEKRKRR